MLASLAILLASCNCYNKMLKKVDRVSVSATPAVLTLKGSNVVTDVRVDFPAKYFNKKAVLKVTPVLVFEGGELVGTPKFIQGEKVKDNYTVIPYKTEEEALAIANDTNYGLYGAVYGEPAAALEFAKKIKAGGVHVNGAGGGVDMPFGGYKQSGIGREGGTFGFEDFLEIKALCY